MIDTPEKRRSMMGFGCPGLTLPVAIGGFGQGERQHLLGLYSGVLLGPPPAPPAAWRKVTTVGRQGNRPQTTGKPGTVTTLGE